MDRPSQPFPTGRARIAGSLVVAIAGFATAALIGVAGAKTFTLQVASNAKVVNAKTGASADESIATFRGFAVYLLTGDSKGHPECTKAGGCFRVWRPVTVSSAKKLSKAPGINGKLGVWRRDGVLQVTLGGHPLYRYAPDTHKRVATGEGIRSFGGTWHVIKTSNSTGTTTQTMTTGTSTTQTTTTNTTTTPCPYPPYC